MQEGITKMEITIPKASNVPRIWNITFISVFITNSLMYVGQQMVQPLITSYAKELGAVEGIIGLIASAFTITSILLKGSPYPIPYLPSLLSACSRAADRHLLHPAVWLLPQMLCQRIN